MRRAIGAEAYQMSVWVAVAFGVGVEVSVEVAVEVGVSVEVGFAVAFGVEFAVAVVGRGRVRDQRPCPNVSLAAKIGC
jgi:hypothetical protein